jgi:hypothetical protein
MLRPRKARVAVMVLFGNGVTRFHVAAVVLVALMCASCGASTSLATTATPTPTAITPSGPPSAQFTTTGTGGLSGSLAVGSVTCSLPGFTGPAILLFTTPQATGVSVRIDLLPGNVTVTADAGSGAQFVARSFTGSGITGFDAAHGAQINSSLTETASGSPPGSIGTVASIQGSVSCNNQQPGSSTVRLAGSTATGILNGGINPVRVNCTPNVGALSIGLTMAGTTPELVDMFGGTQNGTPAVSLLLIPKGATTAQHFTATGAGVTTMSSTSVHFNADVVEDSTPGGTPHTVHISGDVTCGSSVKP